MSVRARLRATVHTPLSSAQAGPPKIVGPPGRRLLVQRDDDGVVAQPLDDSCAVRPDALGRTCRGPRPGPGHGRGRSAAPRGQRVRTSGAVPDSGAVRCVPTGGAQMVFLAGSLPLTRYSLTFWSAQATFSPAAG